MQKCFATVPVFLFVSCAPLCYGGRYVGVLKKFSKYIEGSVIEGQMDPAVVGKFKMTPLVSSMASDLKKAAEANDSVSLRPSASFIPPRLVNCL